MLKFHHQEINIINGASMKMASSDSSAFVVQHFRNKKSLQSIALTRDVLFEKSALKFEMSLFKNSCDFLEN